MQSQSHKVVIPQKTLSYRDAPYMRVYIAESVGFSSLGFRLETTGDARHLLFSQYGCMTLEGQRCLAEMLEFQFGKERCSQLLLLTKHHGPEEDGFLVTRKDIGHVFIFTFGVQSKP